METPSPLFVSEIQLTMGTTCISLKQKLARIFDDNLKTRQWLNAVDWVIIALIVISTVEVFLSTFDGISERYGAWLNIVDLITTVFFTVEVTLRIWCADLIDDKYKGFWGRVRYCFSFYGFIDLISTYSFYVALFFPVPYAALKVLRVFRLLRVFRYMDSFSVVTRAFSSKKKEMWISLQFLFIVTLILSFLLFFVEHQAQPEVYDNGWRSVLWAFAQYIGDPGNFADTPPITFWGRVIAVLVGVLGIAIFAVPAGLIGSGFIETIEEDKKARELKENAAAINEMMLVKSIRRENLFWPAVNISFGDLKLSLNLSEDDILKAVGLSSNLRVKNLAAAVTDGPKTDMMVVNQFCVNKEYGSHLERGSSVTIVNPVGIGDNGLSYFDWHIAQLGDFNYVANEKFSRQISDSDKRYNFYTVEKETEECAAFQQFITDVITGRGKGDWIVVIAGEQIVKNQTDLHFEFGGEKGEERFGFEGGIAPDRATVKTLFNDMQSALQQMDLTVDAHKVQPKLNPLNIARYLQSMTEANVLLITVSYKLMVFDQKLHGTIMNIADVLNRDLEHNKPVGLHKEEYSVRPINSDYWKKLYNVRT